MSEPACKTCVSYQKKEKRCPKKLGVTQAWDLCREHEEKK